MIYKYIIKYKKNKNINTIIKQKNLNNKNMNMINWYYNLLKNYKKHNYILKICNKNKNIDLNYILVILLYMIYK